MLDRTQPRDAKIDRRLRADLIVWFASTRPDGRPHNVPVWFEWDGESVLLFVQPGSQKVRNLRHESRVVLALDTKDDGEDVVILEGVAELLPQPSRDLMSPAFAEKYTALWDRISSNPAKMAAEYSQAVRVRPKRFLAW